MDDHHRAAGARALVRRNRALSGKASCGLRMSSEEMTKPRMDGERCAHTPPAGFDRISHSVTVNYENTAQLCNLR